MKDVLPKPIHESYLRHRRQLVGQIIVPIVLTAILFIAVVILINIVTFRDNGNVARWAAISTIWIVIPILVASVIFLGVLIGLIYLLARLLGIAPTYTSQAQNFVHMLAIRIQRAADATANPVIYLDGMGASIKRLFGRK